MSMRALMARVANMVGRAVVRRANDAGKLQTLQVDVLADETRGVERMQNYGLTSVPPSGSEAVVVFVGGRRDHGLAVAVDDRRCRLSGLAEGEVAVYSQAGAKVVLKANGDIELTPAGKVLVTGNVEVIGTLTASTDVVGGGKSLKGHTHAAGGLAAPSGGGPVTGVTGAPS